MAPLTVIDSPTTSSIDSSNHPLVHFSFHHPHPPHHHHNSTSNRRMSPSSSPPPPQLHHHSNVVHDGMQNIKI